MRVLIIGNANGFGGAQTAFRKLVDFALNESGVEVGVVSITDDCKQLVQWKGLKMHVRLPLGRDSLTAKVGKQWRILRTAMAARRFAPDLFITVGLAQSANLIARLLPQKTFTIAQDFIHGRAADDVLLVASAAAFDAIAVQAPAMVDALRQNGFNARAVTWLPCFPEAPVSGVVHEPPRERHSLRFAYFGRLAANKGLPMLVSALHRATFSQPIELHVWGSGPEESLIRDKITALGMQGRVQLRGRYPDGEEAARLMCSYDALLLTSTGTEGLPLILLEAMAYGLPFLATDVGAIRDCCADNPDVVMVQPDEAAVARGLSELAGRLQCGEIQPERLRRHYRKHFSPVVMGDRWRLVLQKREAFFA